MAVRFGSSSRVKNRLPRYSNFWDGTAVYSPFTPTGSYDALATYTVGSGGVSSITFSGIPSTYTHLQIRALHAIDAGGQGVNIRFNGDTGNNYAYHLLYGDGSSAAATSSTSRSTGDLGFSNQASGSAYSVFITDILDYNSSSKYKTVRSLNGTESNNTYNGYVWYASTLWQSTTPINSISMFYDSQSFRQYSQFALYGVKG